MSLPVEIVTVRLEQRVSGEAWFGFWGRFRRDLDPRTVFASGFSGYALSVCCCSRLLIMAAANTCISTPP